VRYEGSLLFHPEGILYRNVARAAHECAAAGRRGSGEIRARM
jgi:hypothetical protein